MSILNLFPENVPIANPDGTATAEFLRALAILFTRVGGALGDGGLDIIAPTVPEESIGEALTQPTDPEPELWPAPAQFRLQEPELLFLPAMPVQEEAELQPLQAQIDPSALLENTDLMLRSVTVSWKAVALGAAGNGTATYIFGGGWAFPASNFGGNIISWNQSASEGETNLVNVAGTGSDPSFRFQGWDGASLTNWGRVKLREMTVHGTGGNDTRVIGGGGSLPGSDWGGSAIAYGLGGGGTNIVASPGGATPTIRLQSWNGASLVDMATVTNTRATFPFELQAVGAGSINNKAPVTNTAAPAVATDLATTMTLSNDIRARLIAFGLYT